MKFPLYCAMTILGLNLSCALTKKNALNRRSQEAPSKSDAADGPQVEATLGSSAESAAEANILTLAQTQNSTHYSKGKTTCLPSPTFPNFGFNALIFGNMSHIESDTEGRVAVKGDATFADYIIGAALAKDATRADLVVGQNLFFKRGQVASGATFYGAASVTDKVVFFEPPVKKPNYFPFGRAEAWAQSVAFNLESLPPNGQMTISGAGPRYLVTLSGTNSTVNIFRVKASDLRQAYEIRIQVPTGSSAILNIQGQVVTLTSLGFVLTGVEAAQVLLNMPSATQLQVESVGVLGSILAPRAAVIFSNGQINGFLVGGSFVGDGQINWQPFKGCLPWRGHGSDKYRGMYPPLAPAVHPEMGPQKSR